MNSLCESLMVLISPESVVVDKTAEDSLKRYTSRELVSVTCAVDVSLVTDSVGNADVVAMLDGAMAKSKHVNAEHFFSLRKLTSKFPKSKYDCAAIVTTIYLGGGSEFRMGGFGCVSVE